MGFENYCDHMLRIWLFCKPDLFLKLNYSLDCKAFRTSLCWQFTYLHNLAWTFLGHIYRIILVYETEKYAIYFRLPVLSHWYLSKRVWVKFMTWEWNYVKLWAKFPKSVFTLLMLLFYQTNQQARSLRIMVFELINIRWLGKSSACTLMLNLKTFTSGSKCTSRSMCKNGLSTTDIVTRQPLRVD